MNDLETMRRAKVYLDKLAQGIDPITNQEVCEDSVLNNVRLARCFFYVSDIIGQVIDNGGVVGQVTKTVEFAIAPDQLALVRIREYPVRITELMDELYHAVGNPQMKRPSAKKFTDWLIEKGCMAQITDSIGKTHRIPTDRGVRMGMSTRLRQSRDGEYQAVYYDVNMQRFLLDNLAEILE